MGNDNSTSNTVVDGYRHNSSAYLYPEPKANFHFENRRIEVVKPAPPLQPVVAQKSNSENVQPEPYHSQEVYSSRKPSLLKTSQDFHAVVAGNHPSEPHESLHQRIQYEEPLIFERLTARTQNSNTSDPRLRNLDQPMGFSTGYSQKHRKYVENFEVPLGIYSGEIIDGVGMDGNGTLRLRDGSTYTGGFSKNKMNGEGQIVFNDKEWAKGSWMMGIKDGLFEEHWDGGRQYFKGTYEGGVRNGEGTLRMADGKLYQGHFENDRFHGIGKLIMADEDVTYRGEFRNGAMSGRGVMTWMRHGGSTYDGEVINGRRNGFGVYTDNRNNKFIGYWKDDKKNGEGFFVTELGAKYKIVYNMDHEVEKDLQLE